MWWPFNRTTHKESRQKVDPTVQDSYSYPSGNSTSDFFSMGNMSSSGTSVTEKSVMSISSVYACVSLIAGAIASMPIHLYKRENGYKVRFKLPLEYLLNEEPNAKMPAAVFWEYMIQSLLLHGDAFAMIKRESKYSINIVAFIPCHPETVEVLDNADRLAYKITTEKGVVVLDQDDVIHIPGLGFNGKRGMSPLKYVLKNSAGIAQASDEFSGSYFANAAKTDMAIVVPGKIDEAQVKQMKQNFMESRKLGNSFEPAVLSNGATLQPITITAEDAQLLETRKFTVEEIARIYGVPPFMIGHTEKTTSFGNGVENMGIGFTKYTLQRHLIKSEQELNRKCIRSSNIFLEFNTAGLERGDIKTRFDAYRIALGRAGEEKWMEVEDIRMLENLGPMKNPTPQPVPVAQPGA